MAAIYCHYGVNEYQDRNFYKEKEITKSVSDYSNNIKNGEKMKINKSISVVVLAMLFFSGCEALTPDNVYDVIYEVTGTSTSVNIQYNDVNGYPKDLINVTLPWTLEMHVSVPYNRMASLMLFVSNIGGIGTGSVTATLYVDGSISDTETDDNDDAMFDDGMVVVTDILF